MPKVIQLRNVPDALHRKLKAKAALEGLSLSDYLIAEARRVAERPTVAELGLGFRQAAEVRRDLSDVVGTWRRNVAVEAAFAAQDRVDQDLWK